MTDGFARAINPGWSSSAVVGRHESLLGAPNSALLRTGHAIPGTRRVLPPVPPPRKLKKETTRSYAELFTTYSGRNPVYVSESSIDRLSPRAMRSILWRFVSLPLHFTS